MTTVTIELQLERLRRHYEMSMQTYDQISLLELSHTLRVWADMNSGQWRSMGSDSIEHSYRLNR